LIHPGFLLDGSIAPKVLGDCQRFAADLRRCCLSPKLIAITAQRGEVDLADLDGPEPPIASGVAEV
jgi:hypothetical protein